MSVYTISPITADLAGGGLVTYTVPAGYVFVIREIDAGTTGTPGTPPLSVYLDGAVGNLIDQWIYSAGVQTHRWQGRISLEADRSVTCKNNMGVQHLYVVLTGYIFPAS